MTKKEKEFQKASKMFQEWFRLEDITEKDIWNLNLVIGRFASRYLQIKK
jgi:hypothetical protein